MFLQFFQQIYVVAAAKGRSAPLAGAPTEDQEEDAKMFTTGWRNHGDHRGSAISESGDLMKMALLSTSLLWKSLVLVYLWMSFCCDFFRSWLSVAWCTFLGLSWKRDFSEQTSQADNSWCVVATHNYGNGNVSDGKAMYHDLLPAKWVDLTNLYHDGFSQ